MASVSNKQLSIKLAGFFLRFVGFWVWNDSRQKRWLDLALSYTIVAVIWGTGVIWMDLYYSMGDFSNFAYALTNVFTLLMVLFKLLVFALERENFIALIRYSKKNFWDVEYDDFGKKVLDDCEKKCVLFVFTFTTFAQSTVCSYTITPIIGNIGKNDTDRDLPFNIWVDLPVTTSPYFEIIFSIQSVFSTTDGKLRDSMAFYHFFTFYLGKLTKTLSLYHVGILYFCFDNLLCILNIHVKGQFRILCHRLGSICDLKSKDGSDETQRLNLDKRYVRDSRESLKRLNDCVRQHQSLIGFVERMEDVFRLTILGQVLIFSALICLVSYQAFLVGGQSSRKIIFLVHCAGTFTQLLMFTLTCHDLWDSSCHVADGVYESGWYMLRENNASTRNLRKNLMLVIMRARRPCYLTAFGFFPISLETFTKINSTAISYLTLLRESAS